MWWIRVCFSPTGVFGELDLHGIPHSIYKTKLSETAEAGSKVLSLMDAVDWQVEELLCGGKWIHIVGQLRKVSTLFFWTLIFPMINQMRNVYFAISLHPKSWPASRHLKIVVSITKQNRRIKLLPGVEDDFVPTQYSLIQQIFRQCLWYNRHSPGCWGNKESKVL